MFPKCHKTDWYGKGEGKYGFIWHIDPPSKHMLDFIKDMYEVFHGLFSMIVVMMTI